MLSSLFGRKIVPECAFRQPDHQAAVQVEDKIIDAEYSVKLSNADLAMANQYLSAKPLASEYEKKSDAAKKALLASLGSASSGLLPDGRYVTKHVTPVPAESKPRAGHNRTSITIQ